MIEVRYVFLAFAALSWIAACDGGNAAARPPNGARPDAGGTATPPWTTAAGGRGGVVLRRDGGSGGNSVVDARTAEPSDSGSDARPSIDGPVGDGAGAGDGSIADRRDSGERDAGADDRGESILRVPGWSVRKRVRSEASEDLVLEEVLANFGAAAPGATRVRRLASAAGLERSWSAPAGAYLSDFCRHPSGAISVIVVGSDHAVSLVRLTSALTPLGTARIRDPGIAGDPHVVTDAGVAELFGNGLSWDVARIASTGEDVVATVFSSWNSIIAYRAGFANRAWSDPERTLVEPPAGITPNLPTGGSFDTFGAMVAWFRPLLDVDEDGNAYVAAWASRTRIRAHAAEFGDGLTPLPGDPENPSLSDSDVLLTKLDPSGARVWSRVIGTPHEDEPYALRARFGVVAVAGRARRFPGFDNTIWDAYVSVTSTRGDIIGSRPVSLDASGIFLAVDILPSGGLVLGGSDGWSQNPDGLSVLSFGNKLLLELPTFDGPTVRVPLTAGPRHNEIRAVVADTTHRWFAGHEDGPVMHTGDSDPNQIRATGVIGYVPAPDEHD